MPFSNYSDRGVRSGRVLCAAREILAGRSCGFAYVMALMVSLLVAGIATTLAVVSATESQIARNYVEQRQTIYLAEAGIEHALWQLSLNPKNTAPLVEKGLGPGKYDVLIGDVAGGLFEIAARGRTSTALGNGVRTRAAVFPQSLNYAIAAKDYVDQSLSAQVDGAVLEGALSEMDVDWAALRSMADWYLTGNQDFWHLNFQGILYVTGDVNLYGNTQVIGTIVSEHGVRVYTFTGNRAFIKGTAGMPALVASDDIVLGRDNEWGGIGIDGCVYSAKKIKLREYNRIWLSGAFVSKDNFEIEDGCPEVRIRWDPTLRLQPPACIAQHSADPWSWTLIPGTWEILSDLSGFAGT